MWPAHGAIKSVCQFVFYFVRFYERFGSPAPLYFVATGFHHFYRAIIGVGRLTWPAANGTGNLKFQTIWLGRQSRDANVGNCYLAAGLEWPGPAGITLA